MIYSEIIFSDLTGNDSVLIFERLLNGRQTDGPDIAVECGGPVNLDDGDIVFVSRVHEIPMCPYLRHREIQRPRLVGLGEVVFAQSHDDVARFVPGTTRRDARL